MSLSQQEFTNAGRSMLGRAQNGEILTISKIVVGSGAAAQPSDLWPLTQCIAPEMDVVISARHDFGNGILLVEGSFKSTDAPHAFDLRELGVMAHCGAEADRLYSVSNAFTDPVDHIDPHAPTIQAFKVKLVIDRIPTANIIIQIGPSENVLGENIGADTVGPGFYKEAAGNVLRFKRAVQGHGMLITEDTPDTVRFDTLTNTLQNDVDVYVPMSYPNPPAGAPLFPDIQAAIDYLLSFTIPSDKFARIFVADNTHAPNWPSGDGKYHNANGVNFYHPNASQIALIGWPYETYNATQISFKDATHKYVTLAAGTDMSKFWIGALITLDFCHASWSGGARITSINVPIKQLTVSIVNRSGKAPYSTANTPAPGNFFKLRLYKTIVKCDSTTFGIGNLQFPNGIQRVENIASEGGYACFGAGGNAAAAFKNCLAMGLTDSTAGNNPTVKGFAGGDAGVMALFGQTCCTDIQNFGIIGNIFAPEVTLVNGCTAGIVPQGNATVGAVTLDMAAFGYPDSRAYLTHNGHGARIWGSNMNCGSVAVTNNNVGFALNMQGVLGAGPWGCAGLNNDWDIYAQGMSYVFWQVGDYSFPAHVTPTIVQTIPPTPPPPPNPNGYGEQREGAGGYNSYVVVRKDGNPVLPP